MCLFYQYKFLSQQYYNQEKSTHHERQMNTQGRHDNFWGPMQNFQLPLPKRFFLYRAFGGLTRQGPGENCLLCLVNIMACWSSTPISVAAMHAIYIAYYMFIAGFQENLIAGHTNGVRILVAMTVFLFQKKDTFNK